MKKFIYLFVLTILAGGFTSCEKFLEEKSQDEIRPSTIDDLTALMNGTAYPYITQMDLYLDLLTDEIKCNGAESGSTYANILANGSLLFKFDPSMFDNATVSMLADQDSWQIYYEKINGCNLIKDYIDEVSGTETEKKGVLGQVLFLRAFYYLKLVNIYGQPYNVSPTVNLGVPLMLSSTVSDVLPARNTVAEVYEQIEADLLEAADLLENNYTPASVFRVSYLTAYALLSRVYLYMEDFDKAIECADRVITIKPNLTLLKSYINTDGTYNGDGIYNVNASQELLWVYGSNPRSTDNYFPGLMNLPWAKHPPYSVSEELAALYDQENITTDYLADLRYKFYFATYTNGISYLFRSGKIGQNNNTYGDRGIRLAEVYLNRAEALVRRGGAADLTQALSDLNTLRINRYDTRNVAYVPVDITDAAELLVFCKEERRRELCLEEGHRWFDIKRWGESVTHTFIDENGSSSEHTINASSFAYALPIPCTAIENNSNLEQNPR